MKHLFLTDRDFIPLSVVKVILYIVLVFSPLRNFVRMCVYVPMDLFFTY